ncbi:hypothetical protein [Treponema sp. R6D11]
MGINHKFVDDLDSAIDCFLPILKQLQIKENDNTKIPVCLSFSPELRGIDSIKQWDIVLLKANLLDKDNTALFMLKSYGDKYNDSKMRCYIVIDEIYYIRNEAAKVIHETRMMIVIHEFIHFISYIYARIKNTPKEFL